MDDLHRNYIDGDWVDGEAAPDTNPSNTDEIVGHYVRGNAADAKRAIAAAKAAFPAWSRSGIQQRHDVLKAAADEILKRREELGSCWRVRKARPSPKVSARRFVRVRFSISLPAKLYASRASWCQVCDRGSRCR